ncbi:LytR/AlgR family response regulator transcription factor [Flectobacillus major]|jgi:DNA-binding LytR/AlgR family response regulator|uniref:LytR/AlgR family response regulator transcription factor n=1 Tax=Flectobacillus major TaxID=103 RepID=UPI00041DEA35|nr:LytTR family DNA-binding domain-containing protein [Flectobacillus major]
METSLTVMKKDVKIAYPYLLDKCPPELLDRPKYNITIHIEDIIFIEAQVNYSVIHQRHKPPRVFSITLKNLLPRLAEKSSHFLRVHKAFIVNINCIGHYNSKSLTLKSGKNIPISKRRWKEVSVFLTEKHISFID